MPVGIDKQYDESWLEQDKVKRRLDIKKRLKIEGIQTNFNPFKHMRAEVFSDPAIYRYMDLRKQGRMPNAPFKPTLFWGMIASILIPMVIAYKVQKWERTDYLRDIADGTTPYEKRLGKAIG